MWKMAFQAIEECFRGLFTFAHAFNEVASAIDEGATILHKEVKGTGQVLEIDRESRIAIRMETAKANLKLAKG